MQSRVDRQLRALALAKQHCAKLDVELLDGNVAFLRLALLRDSRGQRRHSADPAPLLQELIGYPLPLPQLAGWLRDYGGAGGSAGGSGSASRPAQAAPPAAGLPGTGLEFAHV